MKYSVAAVVLAISKAETEGRYYVTLFLGFD
jgi:hypothetical protein